MRILDVVFTYASIKFFYIGGKMSKNKYYSYENARSWVYDKDKYINNYIDNMFNRTQKMFKWENLPETIPSGMLEYMLQKNGNVFITKVNGDIYAFNGCLGGEIDAYYQPTIYTVVNPSLKISKDYKIDVDGVLIKNDTRMLGLLPIFSKSSVLNCDCEISLNMLSIILRMQYMISASDDKTRVSAETYINKMKNGDFSVIADSQFFDGVKFQSKGNDSQIINQFIQLAQYIKASAFNEIGLNANFNMKKERLITSEISVNESSLLPLVENMLDERQKAVERINNMFGSNIKVDLSCVWKEQAEIHETDIQSKNNTVETENKAVDNENI